MATATDIYQEVLFNDGEGGDPDDINELQRRMRGMILDTMITTRITNGVQDETLADVLDPELGDFAITGDISAALSQLCYTPYPHVGFTRPGGAARQLNIQPGVFVQWLQDAASADPEFPSCLRFYLSSTLQLTTAIGDATNPRVDVIEMKLEHVEDSTDARDFEDAVTRAKSTTTPAKARRTRTTFQIKQGTPGANPAYPACTAGFCAVAAVWVPATHNAVHAIANLRDLRWPIGRVGVYDVTVEGFNLLGSGANPWTHPPGQWHALADPAAAGFMYARSPIGGHCSRLIAVGVMGEFPGAGDVKLRRIDFAETTPAKTTLADLQTQIHDELSAGPRFAWAHAVHFMIQGAFDIANEGTRNGNIGTPIWSNGRLAGPAFEAGVQDPAHTSIGALAMEFLGDAPDAGTAISLVRFVFAHGM